MSKITGNEPAYPLVMARYTDDTKGMPILLELASRDETPVPEAFWNQMLRQFNDERKCIRRTESHSSRVMTTEEILRVRAAWKVKMAQALIDEYNKQIT